MNLLFVEFDNNTSSATTSMSLFFANKGYHLNITISGKRHYFILCLWICCKPQQTAKFSENRNICYTTTVLIISRCTQNPRAEFLSKTIGIY